jgi:hypothetical protein
MIANENPFGRIVLFDHSGALFPTAGEENLRIIRGRVSANGAIIGGAFFSVSHPGVGVYEITFDTHFATTPSVVATPTSLEGRDNEIASVDPGAFTLRMHVNRTDFVDEGFHFIAIGSR